MPRVPQATGRWLLHCAALHKLVLCSAPSVPQPVFTNTEKAPRGAKVIRDGRVG